MVSNELKNKYLRENGISAVLIVNVEKESRTIRKDHIFRHLLG